MSFREFVDLEAPAQAAAPVEPERFLPWKERALAIAKEAAVEHGVTLDEIRGSSRRPHIVAARHEAWLRIRNVMHLSYPSIGSVFFGVDHTTVIHGCRRAELRREKAVAG
jgi:chromosomal replication initiation ATPase DnaA